MQKVINLLFVVISFPLFAQKPAIKVVNNSGCAALTATVSDTANYTGKSALLRTWYWGDGQQLVLTKDTSSHTYYVAGNYTIKLVVDFSNGTKDSTTYSVIQVFAKPQIQFAISPAVSCHPQTVTFIDNTQYKCGSRFVFTVDYGDGVIEDSTKTQVYGNVFSHLYQNPGNYHVKFIMKNTCGCVSDTTYFNGVIVKQTPKASFNGIDTIGCNDNAFPTFINTTTGTSNTQYYWTFGDGGASALTSPSHFYSAPPFSFNVKLVAINPDGNCKDSITKTAMIKINDLSVDFSMSRTGVCATNPDTIQFNNLTTGYTALYWDFGDNTFSTLPNPKKRYTSAGIMNVKLTVQYQKNGIVCSKSITKTVVVDAKPLVRFIPSDTFFCGTPGSISFNNTTTGASTYAWAFENANPASSSLKTPGLVLFAQAGWVTLIATSANGCVDTFKRFISNSGVNKNISIDQTQGCVPLTVNFNNLSTPIKLNDSIVSFKWDLDGDGVFEINGKAGSKTYLNPCFTWVKYEMRTKLNCFTRDSVQIKHGIKKKPAVQFLGTIGCRDDIMKMLYKGQLPVDDVIFSPTGKSISTTDTSRVMLPINIGPMNLPVVITSKYCGCEDTAQYNLFTNIKGPYANFSFTTACAAGQRRWVNFLNTSTAADSAWWYLNGQYIGSQPTNFSYQLGYSGCHQMKLIAKNNTSGCYDTLIRGICVYDSINNYVDTKPICINQLKLYETSGAGIGQVRWIFQSPGYYFDTVAYGTTLLKTSEVLYATIQRPFSVKGIHNLSIVTTDLNGCKDSFYHPGSLIVNKVVAHLQVDSPTCINNPVRIEFIIDSTYLPITTHIFNPNGTPFNVGKQSYLYYSYPAPVFKNIVGIARDSVGCQTVQLKPIVVLDIDARFTKSKDSICPGQSIVFKALNTDTNVQYRWLFQDASVTSYVGKTTPPIVFNSLGNKVVALLVNNPITGCIDTNFDVVHVIQLRADFKTDKSEAICNATIVNFRDTSFGNVSKYYWDFGDGSGIKQLTKNPSNLYLYPDEYFIKLVVENPAGCRDSIIKNAFNLRGPIAKYTLQQLDSCDNAPMQLALNSKYATRVEAVTGIGAPSVFTYIPGVCGVVNTGCKDTVKYVYNVPGTYTVQINVTDNTCSYFLTTKPLQVNIYDRPDAGFIKPAPAVCAEIPIQLQDTSRFKKVFSKKYVWSYGSPTNFSDSVHPVIQFQNMAGKQTIKQYVYSAPGCYDSSSQEIEVWSLPNIWFEVKDTCVQKPITIEQLSATQKLKKWMWQFGDGNSDSVLFVPKHIYQNGGIYNITLTLTDSNGCSSKLSKMVRINIPPILNLPSDTIKCILDSLSLTLKGSDRYVWKDQTEMYLINDSMPVFMGRTDRSYRIQLKRYGCEEVEQVLNIKNYPENKVEAWADPGLIEKGNSALLRVQTDHSYKSIEWSPNEYLTCNTCMQPSASPQNTTIYKAKVWYEVSGATCASADTALIEIDERNIAEIIEFVNIFSPNGDGANDKFRINIRDAKAELVNFEMRIYNRWGEKVFETNDWRIGWDGYFMGSAQPVGTYICFVFYTLKGRKSDSRSYPINLVR